MTHHNFRCQHKRTNEKTTSECIDSLQTIYLDPCFLLEAFSTSIYSIIDCWKASCLDFVLPCQFWPNDTVICSNGQSHWISLWIPTTDTITPLHSFPYLEYSYWASSATDGVWKVLLASFSCLSSVVSPPSLVGFHSEHLQLTLSLPSTDLRASYYPLELPYA